MAGVTVHCHLKAGAKLRLFEMKPDIFGINGAVYAGETLTLRPGRNEGVDADFLAHWREQNRDHDALLGAIVIEEDQLPGSSSQP